MKKKLIILSISMLFIANAQAGLWKDFTGWISSLFGKDKKVKVIEPAPTEKQEVNGLDDTDASAQNPPVMDPVETEKEEVDIMNEAGMLDLGGEMSKDGEISDEIEPISTEKEEVDVIEQKQLAPVDEVMQDSNGDVINKDQLSKEETKIMDVTENESNAEEIVPILDLNYSMDDMAQMVDEKEEVETATDDIEGVVTQQMSFSENAITSEDLMPIETEDQKIKKLEREVNSKLLPLAITN